MNTNYDIYELTHMEEVLNTLNKKVSFENLKNATRAIFLVEENFVPTFQRVNKLYDFMIRSLGLWEEIFNKPELEKKEQASDKDVYIYQNLICDVSVWQMFHDLLRDESIIRLLKEKSFPLKFLESFAVVVAQVFQKVQTEEQDVCLSSLLNCISSCFYEFSTPLRDYYVPEISSVSLLFYHTVSGLNNILSTQVKDSNNIKSAIILSTNILNYCAYQRESQAPQTLFNSTVPHSIEMMKLYRQLSNMSNKEQWKNCDQYICDLIDLIKDMLQKYLINDYYLSRSKKWTNQRISKKRKLNDETSKEQSLEESQTSEDPLVDKLKQGIEDRSSSQDELLKIVQKSAQENTQYGSKRKRDTTEQDTFVMFFRTVMHITRSPGWDKKNNNIRWKSIREMLEIICNVNFSSIAARKSLSAELYAIYKEIRYNFKNSRVISEAFRSLIPVIKFDSTMLSDHVDLFWSIALGNSMHSYYSTDGSNGFINFAITFLENATAIRKFPETIDSITKHIESDSSFGILFNRSFRNKIIQIAQLQPRQALGAIQNLEKGVSPLLELDKKSNNQNDASLHKFPYFSTLISLLAFGMIVEDYNAQQIHEYCLHIIDTIVVPMINYCITINKTDSLKTKRDWVLSNVLQLYYSMLYLKRTAMSFTTHLYTIELDQNQLSKEKMPLIVYSEGILSLSELWEENQISELSPQLQVALSLVTIQRMQEIHHELSILEFELLTFSDRKKDRKKAIKRKNKQATQASEIIFSLFDLWRDEFDENIEWNEVLESVSKSNVHVALWKIITLNIGLLCKYASKQKLKEFVNLVFSRKMSPNAPRNGVSIDSLTTELINDIEFFEHVEIKDALSDNVMKKISNIIKMVSCSNSKIQSLIKKLSKNYATIESVKKYTSRLLSRFSDSREIINIPEDQIKSKDWKMLNLMTSQILSAPESYFSHEQLEMMFMMTSVLMVLINLCHSTQKSEYNLSNLFNTLLQQMNSLDKEFAETILNCSNILFVKQSTKSFDKLIYTMLNINAQDSICHYLDNLRNLLTQDNMDLIQSLEKTIIGITNYLRDEHTAKSKLYYLGETNSKFQVSHNLVRNITECESTFSCLLNQIQSYDDIKTQCAFISCSTQFLAFFRYLQSPLRQKDNQEKDMNLNMGKYIGIITQICCNQIKYSLDNHHNQKSKEFLVCINFLKELCHSVKGLRPRLSDQTQIRIVASLLYFASHSNDSDTTDKFIECIFTLATELGKQRIIVNSLIEEINVCVSNNHNPNELITSEYQQRLCSILRCLRVFLISTSGKVLGNSVSATVDANVMLLSTLASVCSDYSNKPKMTEITQIILPSLSVIYNCINRAVFHHSTDRLCMMLNLPSQIFIHNKTNQNNALTTFNSFGSIPLPSVCYQCCQITQNILWQYSTFIAHNQSIINQAFSVLIRAVLLVSYYESTGLYSDYELEEYDSTLCANSITAIFGAFAEKEALSSMIPHIVIESITSFQAIFTANTDSERALPPHIQHIIIHSGLFQLLNKCRKKILNHIHASLPFEERKYFEKLVTQVEREFGKSK